MSLRRLEVRDFRCIAATDLEFDGRCNLISGANATGKTSLLEAIFFLGRGRSFRTARNETLIRKGAEELLLTGRFEAGESIRPVGVRYSREGFEARAGGNRIGSLAELASILPVQAIDPEVHRLVEDGPQERRRYLDWGVFHVEPRFVEQWRRYQRALKQRNAALRLKRRNRWSGPGIRSCWSLAARWRLPVGSTLRNWCPMSRRSANACWARASNCRSATDGWPEQSCRRQSSIPGPGTGSGDDARWTASGGPLDPGWRRPGQASRLAWPAETDGLGDAPGAAAV